MLNTAIAAVSLLNLRSPRLRIAKPALTAEVISSFVNPPSGPINRETGREPLVKRLSSSAQMLFSKLLSSAITFKSFFPAVLNTSEKFNG